MDSDKVYNEIMRDSKVRKEAVERLIHEIQIRSMHHFSEEGIKKIKLLLSFYEVESGVQLFFERSRTTRNGFVARVDVGKEYVNLWWGVNRNSTSSNPKKYWLGINYVLKNSNEIAYYFKDDLIKEFPAFTDYICSLGKEKVLRVFAYSKAGAFYADVKDQPGEWILQIPNGKSFIPSRPIGKLIGKNNLYIFQPNNQIRTRRYIRTLKLVDD